MKKYFLISFIFINTVVSAQNNSDKINNTSENIIVFTDRDLYLSGEKIWFNALCLSKGEFKEETISKITYFELFNEEKKSVIQKKVRIIKGESSSFIEIPENIETGVYNLIAYTQYIKNFKGFKSNRISLIIINPGKKGNVKLTNSIIHNRDSSYQKDELNILEIKTDKKVYNTKEKVALSLSEKNFINKPKYLVISVIKKGSLNNYFCSNIDPDNDIKSGDFDKIKYYPEIRDLTLSGTLNEKETNDPISNTKIYLSVLGKNNQVNISQTDNNGRFIFTLNSLYNNQDIYICTEDESINSEMLVNNSFLYELDYFRPISYIIDSTKIELIKEMYLNYQTTEYFPDKSEIIKINKDTTVNFFGKSEIEINIDDFIKLPTLHEVFDEIIPFVYVKKKKENYSFLIYDVKNKTTFKDPLVFYDQIPIFNINELLKIKPKFIDQINVINRKYIIGNYIFNGIIFIKSKTGKLPGINIPKNSIITKYQTTYESYLLESPEYDETKIKDDHLPDFRTLLYWNPDVTLKDNKTLHFYTSDHSSEYDVIIRGISSSGKLFFGQTSFEVKK
ncbi:MAG: hypothetical protein K8R54_07335 [Bacteroidales bacterium]|nr:hypothetical protein [Bacteroidales bacterium]